MSPKIRELRRMNAIALAEDARWRARQLENKHRHKGLTRDQAREDIAREIEVTPATLDSINRRRVKNPHRLKGLIADLTSALLREIANERRRLDHEEHLLMQGGARPDGDEMQAVAKDRAALDRAAEEALRGV